MAHRTAITFARPACTPRPTASVTSTTAVNNVDPTDTARQRTMRPIIADHDRDERETDERRDAPRRDQRDDLGAETAAQRGHSEEGTRRERQRAQIDRQRRRPGRVRTPGREPGVRPRVRDEGRGHRDGIGTDRTQRFVQEQEQHQRHAAC